MYPLTLQLYNETLLRRNSLIGTCLSRTISATGHDVVQKVKLIPHGQACGVWTKIVHSQR